MADQANHFARRYVQVDAAHDRTVAITKAYVAQIDPALYVFDAYRPGGFRHGRHMIKYVVDALGAGGGVLRERNDPAQGGPSTEEASDHRPRIGWGQGESVRVDTGGSGTINNTKRAKSSSI